MNERLRRRFAEAKQLSETMAPYTWGKPGHDLASVIELDLQLREELDLNTDLLALFDAR